MNKKLLESLKSREPVGALCLGSFDGVHLGHKSLIEKTLERSIKIGEPSALVTFTPHPREYFSDEEFKRIYPESENEKIIQDLGISKIYYISFDAQNSSMPPEEFLNYLYRKIEFEALIVGFDFKFGSQRSGGVAEIKSWCDKKSLELCVLPKVELDGEKVSSTIIRDCLKRSDFKKAERLMGHPYVLTSKSYKDQNLGRKLGFPTLNLKVPENLVLRNGVYSVTAVVENITYKAIANLGFRPTVGEATKKRVLEVHLIDQSIEDKVYDVEVMFNFFIREEVFFSNVEELKKQIQADLNLLKTSY